MEKDLYKKCPFCNEKIRKEAIKCRFCNEYINGDKTMTSKIKIEKDDKKSNIIKYILRIVLYVILVISFSIIAYFFMIPATQSSLPLAQLGQVNITRYVCIFGFLTLITVFITFLKKVYRLTALLLVLSWILGFIMYLILLFRG